MRQGALIGWDAPGVRDWLGGKTAFCAAGVDWLQGRASARGAALQLAGFGASQVAWGRV